MLDLESLTNMKHVDLFFFLVCEKKTSIYCRVCHIIQLMRENVILQSCTNKLMTD